MGKGFRVTIKDLKPEVTGSCLVFKIKRPGNPFERFVCDMGGFQEAQYANLNEVLDFDPSELSYMFITHSHYDHIARIPLLVKNGFHREIYCSPICKKSTMISLVDILKIMQSEFDSYGKKMLYKGKEVEETESLLKSIEYNLPTHVSKGVKVTLLGNGHLYGASSILLQISCPKYEDKNILITGDYYASNDLFDVKPIPNWVKRLNNLTIIQESTYGDTSKNTIEKTLEKHILTSINDNKNIVMPVISQERLELVLLTLKVLQDKNLLDTKVKIFIHTNLGTQYLNNIYLNNKEIVDFMPKNVVIVPKGDFSTALDYAERKIILSSSGMADNGCVKFYLQHILHRTDYTIIFTCYTPKGTLGHKLRNMSKGDEVKINNEPCILKCDVKHSGELSKHVKVEDIIKYIEQFDDVKNILITHGETKTKESLCTKLKEVFPEKNIFIMDRQTGFKLNPDMDITTYPTNLKNDALPNITSEDKKFNKKNKSKETKKRKTYIN